MEKEYLTIELWRVIHGRPIRMDFSWGDSSWGHHTFLAMVAVSCGNPNYRMRPKSAVPELRKMMDDSGVVCPDLETSFVE